MSTFSLKKHKAPDIDTDSGVGLFVNEHTAIVVVRRETHLRYHQIKSRYVFPPTTTSKYSASPLYGHFDLVSLARRMLGLADVCGK